MNSGRFRRLRALIAGAAIVTVAATVGTAAPAQALAPTRTAAASAVRLQVLDVSPSTPAISSTQSPLTVTLRATNTGATSVGRVQLTALRGDALQSGTELNAAISHPSTAPTGKVVSADRPVVFSLGADASTTVRFVTTTSVLDTPGNVCLCVPHGVYPLYFALQRTAAGSGSANPSGSGSIIDALASTVTYLPAFDQAPATPVHVSWMWPLIDRPHRLYADGKPATTTTAASSATADNVFTDDALTASVSPGGRLRRALDTIVRVEQTGDFPVTLLVDPDLLDELYVMQSTYFVRAGTRTIAEPASAVARTWLDDLATLLATRPGVDVQLTPYADPDVQSLHAHHQTWSATVPAAMRQRVALALAGRPLQSQVAWPPSNALSNGTLADLVDAGVRTIVVGATTISAASSSDATTGVAHLSRHNHTVAAALTDATVERDAAAAVAQPAGTGGTASTFTGTAALPQLVSEVASRAAQGRGSSRSLVITAPRYVDPDPVAAARAIRDSSATPFARAATLAGITAPGKLPRKHSHLPATVGTAGLPSDVLADATDTATDLPKISGLLDGSDRAATQLVSALPLALQRSESAAWVVSPTAGRSYSRTLRREANTLVTGVGIRKPANGGSYTLGSSTSPLPIAVRNTLPYPVRIRLRVQTANQVAGITVQPIGTQTIAAGDQRTIRVPARVQRTGRLQLRVQLMTSRDQDIGDPVSLAVDSTALGIVGVLITIVAGAVLLLALLIRFGRRLRDRRGRRNGTRPRPRTQPIGAAPDALASRAGRSDGSP